MQADEFFTRLWDDYIQVTPQANDIHALVERAFGKVTNDHVAFRTFDRQRIDLKALEKAFLSFGYVRQGDYQFPSKHLVAHGYVPASPDLPLVFLSELKCDELPEAATAWIEHALYSVPSFPEDPAELLCMGRPWALPTWEEYEALSQVSPYAAWLSVWGFRANHFTVAVHKLPQEPTLQALVQRLVDAGYPMNDEGGLFKGTPRELLEQASTLAELRPVTFLDGDEHDVPSCYYEFACRYPDASGQLYHGFVAASANDIFESTTPRKGGASGERGM